MDNKELEAWKRHNASLQYAYHRYLSSCNQHERENALKLIQEEFNWPPFIRICGSASPFGLTRYGLDSEIESCIHLIDKIANEEIEYNDY